MHEKGFWKPIPISAKQVLQIGGYLKKKTPLILIEFGSELEIKVETVYIHYWVVRILLKYDYVVNAVFIVTKKCIFGNSSSTIKNIV